MWALCSSIIQVLYSRIAISLWKSSKGLGRNLQMKSTTPLSTTQANSHPHCRHPSKCDKRTLPLNPSESEVKYDRIITINFNEITNDFFVLKVSMESDKNGVSTWRTHSVHGHSNHHHIRHHTHISTHSTNNVLRARRGVVRMLIVVVLTFALCNLPLHARKMWQYWWVELAYHSSYMKVDPNNFFLLSSTKFIHSTSISVSPVINILCNNKNLQSGNVSSCFIYNFLLP